MILSVVLLSAVISLHEPVDPPQTIAPAGAEDAVDALTPEQVEKDRPQGEVVVTFGVEDVGLLNGAIKVGDPPYRPIALKTKAGLKDPRSQLVVVLVGKALTHVHSLGISDPTAHFRGRTIEARGRVSYGRYPRTTLPDGSVQVHPDSYTRYEVVIDSLDNFRIAR